MEVESHKSAGRPAAKWIRWFITNIGWFTADKRCVLFTTLDDYARSHPELAISVENVCRNYDVFVDKRNNSRSFNVNTANDGLSVENIVGEVEYRLGQRGKIQDTLIPRVNITEIQDLLRKRAEEGVFKISKNELARVLAHHAFSLKQIEKVLSYPMLKSEFDNDPVKWYDDFVDHLVLVNDRLKREDIKIITVEINRMCGFKRGSGELFVQRVSASKLIDAIAAAFSDFSPRILAKDDLMTRLTANLQKKQSISYFVDYYDLTDYIERTMVNVDPKMRKIANDVMHAVHVHLSDISFQSIDLHSELTFNIGQGSFAVRSICENKLKKTSS